MKNATNFNERKKKKQNKLTERNTNRNTNLLSPNFESYTRRGKREKEKGKTKREKIYSSP